MGESSERISARDVDPEGVTRLDSMDALLAGVAAAPPIPIERAQSLSIEPGALVDGTYRVLGRLGGGGMGVVYRAEHVELEREVALKLHTGEVDSHELVRLRREARVMAKLSHPNVLTVHGVGTHEGRMFIAMEYADGGTLGSWLAEGPHDWRRTVERLIEAGRGLAAAHRVGVVHRDFKPDNVLLSADGRAMVADFGLARRSDDPMAQVTAELGTIDSLDEAHRVTVTGAVVGTPAYMSPEQFDGMEVGPASDQFAFCVVLYEALTGRRPFEGETLMALADAVHEGRVRPAPSSRRVPGGLWSAVVRGLQPVPGDRHPSMTSLVAILERIVGARRRRQRWAVGLAVVGVALVAGNRLAVLGERRPCEGAEQELGAAWDEARREAVVAAWSSAEVAARDAAVGAIDDWARRWGAQRREVCEATRVREDASEVVFGLRMACLDRMASRVDGLTRELVDGASGRTLDASIVEQSLPGLDVCEDVDVLDRLYDRYARRSSRDTTAQDRALVTAEALLSRASTRFRLGRSDFVELAEEAASLGRTHDLPGTESHALVLLAEERVASGDAEGAKAMRQRALKLAAADGSDETAADLGLGLAEAALAAGQLEVAAVHLEYFDAFVSRVRAQDGVRPYRQRARVIEGSLHLERGDPVAAIERLSPVAYDLEAEVLLRRSALMRLGRAHKASGRWDDAVATWRMLIELLSSLREPDHRTHASVLNNIATVQIGLGHEAQALVELERAQSLVERSVGSEHPLQAILWTNRGLALRRLARPEAARELQERSLALRSRLWGPDHPSLAYALDELGTLARERSDFDAALDHLQRAKTLRREALGDTHPLVAGSLLRIARVHLDRGQSAVAIPILEQALAIAGEDGDLVVRAELELRLSQALTARDPDVSGRWADAAQTHALEAGPAGSSLRAELERWTLDRSNLVNSGSPTDSSFVPLGTKSR